MTPTELAAAAYSDAYLRFHGHRPVLRIRGSWIEVRDHRSGFPTRYQKSSIERMTRNLNAREVKE